ncbi:DUF4136 domain-containing protein [Arcicella rosea]|uniref:DUF4136 domain-containing protein n=1 Tax=Arcicella rosea TaxID=502909 RepID=A0A841EH57_9BACT|nr:DUF4136 domain-containing protein [Arcicella rosea]MBB6001614.1 hypothetical protein [Arcicella rosea]
MKRIVVTTFIVGLLATSCTRETILVKANNDFHAINTENRSFTIVQEVSRPQESISSLNETVIQEEIEKQMEIRGYTESRENADVLISYAIYDKNLNLQEVKKVYGITQNDVFEVYRKNLKNGTLIISMIDKSSNKVFWTGYASKIMKFNKSLANRDLKNITRAIFDNYSVTANSYLAKNN